MLRRQVKLAEFQPSLPSPCGFAAQLPDPARRDKGAEIMSRAVNGRPVRPEFIHPSLSFLLSVAGSSQGFLGWSVSLPDRPGAGSPGEGGA